MAMLKKYFAATAVLAVMFVAGCGNNGTRGSDLAPDPTTPGGPLVAGGATTMFVVQNNTTSGVTGVAFNSATADSVLAFSTTASGVTTPAPAFSGPTGIFIAGVTTDAAGNIYAAGNDSAGTGRIMVFAAGATGTPTPLRTVLGSQTGLNNPSGITLDSAGNIYVTTYTAGGSTANSIVEFAPNADGNVAPLRTISGALTGLNDPAGIAVDTNGNIYVADFSANMVSIFGATANGNVLPTRTFATVAPPGQIALDSSNNIYLALYSSNGAYGAVNVFPSTATGTPTPTRVVGGQALGSDFLMGMALDSKNNLYTVYTKIGSTSQTYGIATFSPTASGNATPNSVVTSSAFNSTDFGYIAVH